MTITTHPTFTLKEFSPNFKLVIFDVDGTLVDSFHLFVEILNHFAPKYHYPILDVDRIERLRALTPRQIRRELKLSRFKALLLMLECKKKAHQLDTPEQFEGMKELIQQLKSQNIQLGIVTSNSKKNCQHYLGTENLDVFDWTEYDASIYGKQRKIKKIIQKSNLPLEQIIYIGDQITDIRSAHDNGIASGAVTWGFNNSSALHAEQPHYLFHHITELKSTLLNPI